MCVGVQCVTSDTLTSLMERLSGDPRFFSPHRSYIINLEHITALNADSVLLAGGQRIPVVQAVLPALKRAYVAYLSQAGH
ncbi:LytTR family DNA-binding domain-containing protein [Vermiculatibacterium agrestimuris]|uniref:LytTR family DNA-binding domain-containing protein n=1 Tax=Vermiculatibacterium agrestimuris TaxID=2941519 RepID=UPI00203CDDFA|nr:LytTR family DNA-binding domain-containing protein [Vermiculatibacterium agrestimuris]